MSMAHDHETENRSYIALQHRFRGLAANLKSRAFVAKPKILPHRAFRSGLQNLLLDARAAIHPSSFRPFLEWVAEQVEKQLTDLAAAPVAYDELSGIYPKAPVVSLETELLWLTERLRVERPRLSAFTQAVRLVQQATFSGAYEDAIEGVETLQEVFGVSLWSVQLRLALEQLAGGLERQKRYVAEVRSAHRTGLLNFTAYHSSVRNEERTTLAKFIDDIENRITALATHSDPTKIYDRYRLKNEFPATNVGLADILRIEQSQGIIDIYETFVAVVQQIASRAPSLSQVDLLLRCLGDLDIADFRLSKIKELLSPPAQSKLPTRDTALSDALFDGEVRQAVRLIKAVVSEDPWHHIYAGLALAHLRCPESKPVRPTNVGEMIARIQSRCDGSDDTWSQLAKLMLNLRGLPIAVGLLDSLSQLRRSEPDQPWRPWLIGLNSPFSGVEDRPWAWKCNALPPADGPTAAAWREACCPGSKQTFANRLIRAVGHVSRGDWESADQDLGSDDADWPEPMRSLRALVSLHALHALGERERVIALVAEEGSRSKSHAGFLPVVGTLKAFRWQDYKSVPQALAAPIALHLLWAAREATETASILRFATGHVLRRAGVARPSDLDIGICSVQSHELIYFLRYVCVPNILDLSRLFSGSRAILEERQAICGTLLRIDPDHGQEYQEEMVLIANDLALDDGQWIVDSTRIHVDSDALIRWARRELVEDYERYRELADVDIETPQSFEDVLRELNDGLGQRSSFVANDEADAVLVSILRRLADEFLTNASFGLDFFLSKRVRHQSFIGLIRGPLEFAGLITTRETEAGEYHRNVAWVDRFQQTADEARDEIDAALRNFAGRFDDILSTAKDTYLHLKSTEKPGGLIVLSLTDNLIALSRTIIRLDLSFPEFLRVALPILWAAIEGSLSTIRALLTETIKSQVSHEFDVVRAKIRALAEHDPAWLDFDAAIGGAANEVQIKLDEAAQWFVHADTLRQHRLFSLEQMLAIGVDTALKSQRGFAPKVSQVSVGDLHLQAPNLVFVHDVLFVGLGNARKHSGLKNPCVDVSAAWNANNATVTLSVETDCRATLRSEKERQAASIRSVIAEGSHDRRTRIEEGSGFAKLAAVVLQSDRGRIEFGFTPVGRFRLDVTYAVIELNREIADAA